MSKNLEIAIRDLRRARPRNRFVRGSGWVLAALAVGSWWTGGFSWADLVSERRLANLDRFLGELVPYPLQGRPWDWNIAFSWFGRLMSEKGWTGIVTTLAITWAAIALAAGMALLACIPAARSVAHPQPFLSDPRPPHPVRFLGWRSLVEATRSLLVFLRAVPEYIWAFLLIALIGPTAWPAVLALALHNGGILGKLGAEVIENLPRGELAALRGLGARRSQVVALGILPAVLPRFLLFFFYRWETCVREATVLGMLGIVSLGFFIQDSRARLQIDEMFVLILLGSLLVLLGDVVSVAARETVRKGS